MADVKISQLPAATTPLDGTELAPIVQSGTTKRVSVANLTVGRALTASSLTLTTPLAVTSGGTGLDAGTSGGIPYFSSTSAITSSAALAANQLVIGGGAGSAPSTTTTGAGILTFLGTPTSANLAAAVTDETGTGALVFASSPIIATPTLSTSFTSPLHIGGTTASSTLTLQSTSGVGTSDSIVFKVGNNGATTAATFNTSGNLGLGGAPRAWYTSSGVRAFQVGDFPAMWQGANGAATFGFNAYESGGNTYTYSGSSYASMYQQGLGQHRFYTAASGTAGTAITFTQAMTLTADGDLGVGTTSPSNFGAGYKTLDVVGTSGAGVVQVKSTSVTSRWQADESGALLFKTVTNHPIQFYTNDTFAARINTAGVLEICSNTATPSGGSTSARLIFGTTAGFGIYYGSGAPTVSAAQGSIYLRSDGSSTSTRLYVNTNGSTTWTNVTTAA